MKPWDGEIGIDDASAEELDILKGCGATANELLDALQFAYNHGAFPCPLAGRASKPDQHGIVCQSCRLRSWLEGRRYVISETDVLERIADHAERWKVRA